MPGEISITVRVRRGCKPLLWLALLLERIAQAIKDLCLEIE